ncbi:MAG: prohibitin family protein [Anaerolineaceae bacterium]|nr:prohibitin family protein [Anaerolineaceae bacterium]
MNIESVFNTLATIAWLIAIAVTVIIVVQKARNQSIRRAGVIIIAVFIGALLLSLISAGLVFINPQERGVVISAITPEGYRQQALEPGLSWIVPFAENVITYPIYKQTYTMSIMPSEGQVMGDDSIEARTADGQKVLIDASVIYSLDTAEVVRVHKEWQDRYDIDLVRPVARGVIRDAVSQFGVEEVYSTKRRELVTLVTDDLKEQFSANGLILHEFVLRNISFSDEYAASVEQKQIAEQAAQEAAFVVERKKFEADQVRETAKGSKDAAILEAEGRAESRLIEAEAEAEALKMINEILAQNPELINFLYIEKISPNVEVMLLPAESPYIFDLSTLKSGESDTATPTYTVPTPPPADDSGTDGN